MVTIYSRDDNTKLGEIVTIYSRDDNTKLGELVTINSRDDNNPVLACWGNSLALVAIIMVRMNNLEFVCDVLSMYREAK